MGLNLSTILPMFVYPFQAMWRHRPSEEYFVFVGIRAAHTSFSPFTLDFTSTFFIFIAFPTEQYEINIIIIALVF